MVKVRDQTKGKERELVDRGDQGRIHGGGVLRIGLDQSIIGSGQCEGEEMFVCRFKISWN